MGFQIGFPALRYYPSSVTYDPDAQAMFDARALLGDEPTAPYKKAISDYVAALKTVGVWDNIFQLVVFAGATTVASGLVPIRGLTPTHSNLVDGDFNLKTGVKGNTTNKHIATGYNQASFAQNNMHTYMLVTEVPTNGASGSIMYGNGNNGNGSWNVRLNTTSGNTATLCRRDVGTAEVSVNTSPGGFAMSRSVSGSYSRMVADAVTTATRTSQTINNSPYYLLASSQNASTTPVAFSDTRALVWAIGTAATLADYTTPGNDLQTALNAI